MARFLCCLAQPVFRSLTCFGFTFGAQGGFALASFFQKGDGGATTQDPRVHVSDRSGYLLPRALGVEGDYVAGPEADDELPHELQGCIVHYINRRLGRK